MDPKDNHTPLEDTEKASVHVATTGDMSLDPIVVRTLKRKMDFILLPILTVAYLLNSLDRSNLSNAHTAGLATDLHLKGNEYNRVLTYYQIPFVVLGPVVTMCTKTFGARYSMTAMLLTFGAASFATAWTKNFHQLIACRVIVGAAESGFLSSVIYYLSTWYTRHELSSRIGIFYAALVSSSAFGGLLAYGMFQIKGGSYFTWSYLFILEGSLTMLWSIAVFFLLPSNPESAWFLTNVEKEVAQLRQEIDSARQPQAVFSLKESLSEFKNPNIWVWFVVAFAVGTVLTSNANFLAMIVARLGYKTVKTNLYTVAPALTGAVFLVAWCKSSDKLRERGFHAAAAFVVSLIGYVVLTTISTSNTSVLYFAMFLCTIGAYPTTPIGSAWLVSNLPNLNSRALIGGLYISVSNCGGFLTSNIYLAQEAPRYITALRVNLAMCVVGIVSTLLFSSWMRWENRRRDRAQGLQSAEGAELAVGITSTQDPRWRFHS